MKTYFTFRDVQRRCGIPSDNATNWELGQVLRAFFWRMGIEPERLLTQKTDPNPTVDAPHCIAHYPVEHFDVACRATLEWWGDRHRQQDMF